MIWPLPHHQKYKISFFFFFGAQQPLSVKGNLYHLWGWLSVTFRLPPIAVSPTYGGTVYLRLEPMMGMLLSRTDGHVVSRLKDTGW